MKSRKSLIVLFFFLAIACSIVATFLMDREAPISLQTYQSERDERDAQGRLLFANAILKKSRDESVVHDAVLDAVKYSSNDDDNRSALQLIDSSLLRIPEDSDGFRESTLAKGKLLARLGEKEAAKELFMKAIENHWKNAMWRYSESFIDNGDLDKACLLEFERIAGLEPYLYYRGEEESLEIFLTLLRMLKHAQPNQSTVACVYDRIQGIRKDAPILDIARALCLAVDGYASKGAALLQSIDATFSQVQQEPHDANKTLLYKNHREYPHVPLYIASILHKDGNFLAARNAFSEYIFRNKGKNQKIAESAIRLTRDMDIEQNDSNKKDEFCTYLIKSAWFKDPSVRNDIGDENIAILYDQQQSGFAWSGNGVKSTQICKFVVDRYPDTLAAQTCLRNYVMSLGWNNENKKENVRLLSDLVKKTKNDILAATIQKFLAERAMRDGKMDEALSYITDALNRVSPYEKGWHTDYRKEIESLRDKILRMSQAKQLP